MPVELGDYFSSPRFSPAAELAGLRAEQAMLRQLDWYRNPDPPTVLDKFEVGFPSIGHRIPSPNFYASSAPDLFSTDSFSDHKPDTQRLWDSLGVSTLAKSPQVSPLFEDLLARGNGKLTNAVWKDFRHSTEFKPVVDVVSGGGGVGGLLKVARKGVGKVIAKNGRFAFKALAWTVGAPVTPVGVGIAVARLTAQEVLIELAKKGYKETDDYLKKHDRPVVRPSGPQPGRPFGHPAPVRPADYNRTMNNMRSFTVSGGGGFEIDEIPGVWPTRKVNGANDFGLVNSGGLFR